MPALLRTMLGLLWIAASALAVSAPSARRDSAAPGIELFESQIRPLLAARCYGCHSHQAKELKGKLLLDSRAGWQTGGEHGPVVVPGEPDRSRLVQAVRYDDETLRMPPQGKLSEREIAVLVAWVQAGAPDPRAEAAAPAAAPRPVDPEEARGQWPFQPLQPQAPPSVRNAGWCRTPIDRFILGRLEAAGIAPNPPADRRPLIRRAYFDLIGLPPTPQEIDEFLNDSSPDAYPNLIDRLLANPHYGERWARHWLDIARFAESHGFEQDYDRPNAYHYRDFVIRAFNDDLPYDDFVRWQIAGDEYEPDNPLAMMATGFLAAGVHATQITANQAEKERYDELDDITRTIGTTMLGLTVGCARCHDHKYDPISNSDYYRLLSTFSATVRSDYDVNLDPAGYRRAKETFDAEHAPLAAARQQFEAKELPGRFERWRKDGRAAAAEPRWIVLDTIEAKSEGGATFTKLDDGSLLVGGKNPDQDTYTLAARTGLKRISAVRIEALAHESLVKGGPGRAGNGNFGLSDFRVTAAPADGGAAAAELKLVNPRASFDQKGLPVANAIDADKNSCWAVDPEFGKNHAAVFETEGEAGYDAGTVLTFTLEFRCNKQHAIGRPRLAVATGSRPAALDGAEMPESVLRLVTRLDADPAAALTADEQAAVLCWFRTTDPDWRALNERVEQHARQAPVPKTAKVLISSEGVPAVRLHTQGLDFYEPPYFLKRGDPNQKLEVATQSFLRVLMRAPDQEKHWQVPAPAGCRTSYRRRALAQWITDADQGAGALLARVIVNRLWQHHVGRGIVATPSDFGRQGERPTHPELLEWLATDLVQNGWHLKPIHKRMMTSAVYMQTAARDAARDQLDRDNTLFWHRPAVRLEAEVIRDAMLAVSGTLDPAMFGPGTLDPKQRRRSIYFFVKRSQLVPMMILFDAPDALQDISRRSVTTTAPQSLVLMNNAAVRDGAVSFARRIQPAGAAADAVRSAYTIALGRPPSDAELAECVAFIAEQAAAYRADGRSDADELALADFCLMLMSLNEFIYMD